MSRGGKAVEEGKSTKQESRFHRNDGMGSRLLINAPDLESRHSLLWRGNGKCEGRSSRLCALNEKSASNMSGDLVFLCSFIIESLFD